MRIKYIAGLTVTIDDTEKIILITGNQLDNDELLCKVPVVMTEIKELIQEGYSLRFL